jgi:hypothetical protein
MSEHDETTDRPPLVDPTPEELPDAESLGDEGAGPEEPPEVINDPENQAAAEAIRDSTIERNDDEESGA